jgi:hypothetical protein
MSIKHHLTIPLCGSEKANREAEWYERRGFGVLIKENDFINQGKRQRRYTVVVYRMENGDHEKLINYHENVICI